MIAREIVLLRDMKKMSQTGALGGLDLQLALLA